MASCSAAAFLQVSLLLASAAGEKPICQVADSLIGSVGHHLDEWDGQIEIGLNESLNCSMFLEFVYLSRERIRTQLEFVRGNFTNDNEQARQKGAQGLSTTYAMTHMSTAASLVSAHLHIHGALSAARPECLSENLQLLFLMSLRRLKGVLFSQLRHLWVILQGTAELFHQGAGRWLAEVVEVLDADLKTMETVMMSWQPPELKEFCEGKLIPDEDDDLNISETTCKILLEDRPGPPLPPFSVRDPGGVARSTLEIMRRDMFEEWDIHRPVLQALLRHVLPVDAHVADVCAGIGQAADFLNDTGLVTAYAFDPAVNIRLLSRGSVDVLQVHERPAQLWRKFDWAMCLSAWADFGGAGHWPQVWGNLEAMTTGGAVVSCGPGQVERDAVVEAAAAGAPALRFDEALSALAGKLRDNETGLDENVCVFVRESVGTQPKA